MMILVGEMKQHYDHEAYWSSYASSVIDHLHASENILIEMLIAVTSPLDAVVASRNVLRAMENLSHDVFNVRLIKNYAVISNYLNGIT